MEYVCSIKTKSQPFSFILPFIFVLLMEDSTLAANRNHCNFCHDRMAKWRKLRKLKVRILHWACLHFSANPHEKHVLWYPSTKFWQTDPAPWYRLLEATERYWKCVFFFHTHYTTIYPHKSSKFIVCTYQGFYPRNFPKNPWGARPFTHRPFQTWRLVWGKTPPSWPCRQDGRSVNERHASSYKRSWRLGSCCSWMGPMGPMTDPWDERKKIPYLHENQWILWVWKTGNRTDSQVVDRDIFGNQAANGEVVLFKWDSVDTRNCVPLRKVMMISNVGV